jgi:hypothetical protein
MTSKKPVWKERGLFFFTHGLALRREFGFPVWKVSVDAKFSCPNRDGTLGRQGCLFCCPESFSPSTQTGLDSISEQMEEGMKRLNIRYQAEKFLAYFQPSTNTYGPVDQLEKVYRQALAHPSVVGVVIGTRPDCLSDEVLDLLAELSRETWLMLELGIQTIHEDSLRFLQRGHSVDDSRKAIENAHRRGIRLGAHFILGIPGESPRQMKQTAETAAAWPLYSIKLHNLYIVRDTPLALRWKSGAIELPTCEQYAEYAVDFLERQPPDRVIDRVASEGMSDYLVAPEWTAKKHAARRAIEKVFRRRGTFQGDLYPANHH